jgi:hypothetical protein
VCVTIDEGRDTFSASDRSAALLLLARQFELVGEQVVPPPCENAYAVSHVQFGSRITVTLAGPKGQRDATATGMDDVPAVVQPDGAVALARAADGGDRHRRSTERVRHAGSRAESNPFRFDAVRATRRRSALRRPELWRAVCGVLRLQARGQSLRDRRVVFNFQCKSSDRPSSYYSPTQGSSGMTGSWLKLEILRYFAPTADRSAYVGAGLSWSTTNLDHDTTSWTGDGLQGELTTGFEVGRAGSIHVFIQGDVGLPLYDLQSVAYSYSNVPPFVSEVSVGHEYVPSVTISLGLGWSRGGGGK